MYLILQILCIVGGLLAASSLIAKKSADAGEVLSKIAPYQGFIGLGLLFYGLYYFIFYTVPNLITLIKYTGGLMIIALLVLMILVGFILAFNLIAKYALSKNEEAEAKGKALMAKLVPIQVPLGIGLVVVAILTFIL